MGRVTENDGGREASAAGSYDFGVHPAHVRVSRTSTGAAQAKDPVFRVLYFMRAVSVVASGGGKAVPARLKI